MSEKIKLIVLLSLLEAAVPLSNDMYLPALPQMLDYFGTSEVVLNATLWVFYLFLTVGMIFIGPMSDKWGRRALLIPALAVYTVTSILCGFCISVVLLVVLRALQATAVGVVMAVAIAMAADGFEGRLRERVLGIVATMSLIAPMIAPILGSILLIWFDWHACFFALAFFGIISLLLALFQDETLSQEKRMAVSAIHALKNAVGLLSKKEYLALLLITGLAPLGYLAFVSSSSYVYQGYFGLTEQQFGLVYAANAFAAVLGTILSYRIHALLKGRRMMRAYLGLMTLCGAGIALVGGMSAVAFFALFFPFAFACTGLKPLSFSMLLRQEGEQAGAASSVISFVHTALSCVGLVLGSLPWSDSVVGLGLIMFSFSGVAFAGWLAVSGKRGIRIIAFEEEEQSGDAL